MALALIKLWQLLSAIKNRIQVRTAANFRLRIALLAAFSLLHVGLGALLYKWVAAEQSWGEALFTVYAVLYSIPGADITHAPSRAGTAVLNIIFIFGLLVFATILAMITEEVNSFLLAARSGRAPLALSGHILLLNWNTQIPFLLDQFEAVQRSLDPTGRRRHKLAGRPLVILADKDKDDMDALVVGFMRKHKLEVHTRTGKPYRLEHLERVSASAAAAVLVLHPEATADPADAPDTAAAAAADTAVEGAGGSSSVQGSGAGPGAGGSVSGSGGGGGGRGGVDGGAAALKMQTVMALTAQLMGRQAAVVVQVPESDSCSGGSRMSYQLEMLDTVLARSGHDVGLLELPVKRMVHSLAVQAALQPWSASIYTQLLQHGRQPDLTFHHLPASLFAQTTSNSSANASCAHQQPFTAQGAQNTGGSSSGGRASPAAAAAGMECGLSTSFSLRSSSTVFRRPTGSFLAPAGAAAAAGTFSSRGQLRSVGSYSLGAGGVGLGSVRSVATGITPPAAAAARAAGAQGITAAGAAAAAAAAVPEGCLLYEDVRVRYESSGSIVMGFYRSASQQLVLNPVKGSWCEAGDVLVALTRTSGHTSSVFGNLWRPLLHSLTSRTAAQQQQQQQQQQQAVSKVAASAAVAAAAATAVSAAAAGPNNSLAGGQQQQQQPPSVAAVNTSSVHSYHQHKQQQQQHGHSQQHTSNLQKHARSCLPPIVEGSDGAPPLPAPLQQQQQQQQDANTLLQAADGTGQQRHQQHQQQDQDQQQQQDQQGWTESPFANASLAAPAAAAASPVEDLSPFAAVGCEEDDDFCTDTDPLLPPAAAAAVRAGTPDRLSPLGAPSPAAAAAAAAAAVSGGSSSNGLSTPAASVNPASGPAGLRSAPSWLMSARKVMAQQDQQAAAQRLQRAAAAAGSNGSSGGGSSGSSGGAGVVGQLGVSQFLQGDQQRYVVVAGFTARECAQDLLPHLLDFAPAGSRVVFAVGPFDEPPPEFEVEGTVEEDEDRGDGRPPILHQIHYRFLQVAYPTSAEGLQAAGVLEADALLLAAEEGARANSAEADAQVLGTMVELQHLLSYNDRYQRTHSSSPFRSTSATSATGSSSRPPDRRSSWGRQRPSFRHSQGPNGSLEVEPSGSSDSDEPLPQIAAAAAAAVAAAAAAEASTAAAGFGEGGAGGQQLSSQGIQQHKLALQQQQQQWGDESGPATAPVAFQGQQQQRVQSALHVVACVSNTASKAVAAAFFGAMGPHAAAAPVDSSSGSSRGWGVSGRSPTGSSSSVVGGCEFSYELIVPGEVESAVLVQVAGEPLYTRVVHELLGTPEGCELYLLPPSSFGCSSGEVVRFAELQAVGRLVNKTVIGVVAGGRTVLAPGREWRWGVQEGDRVAVLALSWEC